MWNWGQSPFPRVYIFFYRSLYYVEKGTVPNSTFSKNFGPRRSCGKAQIMFYIHTERQPPTT